MLYANTGEAPDVPQKSFLASSFMTTVKTGLMLFRFVLFHLPLQWFEDGGLTAQGRYGSAPPFFFFFKCGPAGKTPTEAPHCRAMVARAQVGGRCLPANKS